MTQNTGKDRLFALDILRGIAACLVLARHLPTLPVLSRGWSEYLVACFHRVGWCGVDLFFVLSGFLISSLLFKEYARHGSLHLARFWVRRAFKIWPCYFAAYGLMVASYLARSLWTSECPRPAETLANAVPNVLFFQNYVPEVVRWPHSWSIAVEEHFYVALPLLLMAVILWRRRQDRTSLDETFKGIGVFLIGVCCFVLFLRILAASRGATWEVLYYQTQFRMDALCFGVVLGYLKHSRPAWFSKLARAWPLLLVLVPAAMLFPLFHPMGRSTLIATIGFTVMYLSFGALVLLAGAYPDFGSRGPRVLVMPAKTLAWIGVYSYTIYLSHSVVYHLPGVPTVRRLILAQTEVSPFLAIWGDRLLFWTLSIGGGVLLARIVEQPFLRLRDRFYPSMRHSNAGRMAWVSRHADAGAGGVPVCGS